MKRLIAIGAGAFLAGTLSLSATAQTDPQAALAAVKHGAMGKIAPALEALYDGADPEGALRIAPVYDGYAAVDAAAYDVEALKEELAGLGARHISSFGRMVSALVPVDALDELAAVPVLAFARPSLADAGAGLVTSEGDIVLRSDIAREQFRVDGSGTRVGILSDSFDCRFDLATTMEDDIASDDLPADIVILADLASGCSDEGRAMGQIVHDVAPGAALAFHTAFLGQAGFANGILRLAAEAGSDVIVDDVIFFAEPMFQDGIIAQAADIVDSWGIPYYSSAGNRARDSYEDSFRAVEATLGGISGVWHDFDPGEGVDTLQDVALTGGFAQTTLSFQWDEPFFSVSGGAGSANDVDAVFFDGAGNPLLDCFADFDPVAFPATGGFPPVCQFGSVDNLGGDAVELPNAVSFIGPVTVQLGFLVADGPAPTRVKYVPFVRSGGFRIAEWQTNSGTTFGHNNAAGAEAVGAAFWLFTGEFAGPGVTFVGGDCIPACLNNFSSAGGVPILIDAQGNRLAEPDVRLKPGVTGPDGGNNTFFSGDTVLDGDGFPNFFGTSASAPHVAAVAALMLDFENAGIAQNVSHGKQLYRMCLPPGIAGAPFGQHEPVGIPQLVPPEEVAGLLAEGARFRRCNAIQPDEVRQVMRETARDMTERWQAIFLAQGGGFLVQVNELADAEGFDFDTGFGMVDAVAALDALIPRRRSFVQRLLKTRELTP